MVDDPIHRCEEGKAKPCALGFVPHRSLLELGDRLVEEENLRCHSVRESDSR